jgi:hypothetical protein
MKQMTAVKFRIILGVSLGILIIALVGAFLLGYKHLKTIGQDAAKRQADAIASENSVDNLRLLRIELEKKADAFTQLHNLRSSSPFPQFDTEQSLRTIAGQLNLPIKNIIFVNTGADGGVASTTGSSAQPAQPSATQNTSTPATATTKNSQISFEFSRNLTYRELISFYDAVETTTPKHKISGLTIPADSSRTSINPGTLTLELATS